MAKDIKLQSFTVENFGGISSDSPIVMYVADAYENGLNIAIASGDEGEGKTSWLTALQGLFCSNLGIEEKNFINKETGKLSASFEFKYKDSDYRVSWTKSAFKLQKKEYNELSEKNVWKDELSPVATLQKVIGYVGISPMSLKTKDGAKQVDEIRKALSITGEVKAEENKLLESFEVAKISRTNANREYERLKKALEANAMYVNWEVSEEEYAEPKSSEREKQKVKELEVKKDQHTLAGLKTKEHEAAIVVIEGDITDYESQIAALQKKLEFKQNELKDRKEKLETGNAWLKDNDKIVSEYDDAKESYMGVEKYLAEQSQWLAVKKQKSEMDQYSELVIQADGLKDNLREKLLEVGKKGLPPIEGLEVVTSDAIEGMERGVYLNGKNVYQLSESELWGLFLKIWESQNVRFVFIENVQSLGSHAVETLNDLAAKNIKIFATRMERGSTFKIEIVDKIE